MILKNTGWRYLKEGYNQKIDQVDKLGQECFKNVSPVIYE